MNPTIRRWSFFIPIVLFTLACSLVVWLAFWFTGNTMGQAVWGMISYFMLFSMALHAWQEHALRTDPKGFTTRYLAGLSIKMLVSLMVLVILLLLLPQGSKLPVVLTFILLYLAYLGFSTARMTMLLRRISRK